MAMKSASKRKTGTRKLKDGDMVTIRRSKLAMFQRLVKANAKRSDSHHDPKDPPSGDGDVYTGR